MRFLVRFQWERVKEEAAWLASDLLCLLLALLTLPVPPVLLAFDKARHRDITE